MNLDRLNDMQREAATYTEGPLLILAGAGSGKTQTMTYRIAYLVEQGISPYAILAVTFTNKAAREMRERVEKLIGEVPGIWVTTFHSACLRILRTHAERLGYKPNFTVYDPVDQKTLVKNIMKDLNYDVKQLPIALALNIISDAKENDLDPEEYYALNKRPYGNTQIEMAYNVYKEYEKRLKASNSMDFDDLLLKALHLLKQNPDILKMYQDKFKYIMVDEYQDTNHIQYEIVLRLASEHQNICVVGDDDQAIYEWRGADISNILDFEKDFKGAKIVKLEQNYRSTGYILDAANSVIKHNENRKVKKLWTEKEKGSKVFYHKVEDDKEEAKYIAREIYKLIDKYEYSDVAVLYRANSQSKQIEDALRLARIPYQVLSGMSFYQRKETKDVMSYLRLVANPSDDVSLVRIINEPKRGIGQTSIEKIRAMAIVDGISVFEEFEKPEVIESLNAKQRDSVESFTKLIKGLNEEIANLTITDIYDQVTTKSGYIKALEDENTDESQARLENLLDFKSAIADFEEEKRKEGVEPVLTEFLENITLASDQDGLDETESKVTLMTLHGAKGLEFPVVFIPGMEDGTFPTSRAMDSGDFEEERRLCYVGFTRAEEKLYLLSAGRRMTYGHYDDMRESMFLRELDKKTLDESGDQVYEKSSRINNRLGIDTGTLDGYSKPEVVHYDTFKYAKMRTEENAKLGDATFIEGDNVTHTKFGHGVVCESDDKTVTVNFDEFGIKKLAKGFAPLTKVD